MKVTITTPFARLSVEMDAMKAATFLTEALIAAVPEPTVEQRAYADLFRMNPEYEADYTAPVRHDEPSYPHLTVQEEDPAPDNTNTPPDTPVSAITNDDGFDDDLDNPVGFSAYEPTPEKGYRGFLHMKCDKCHKEKSFHIKWPLKEYRCECGHTMPLHGLSKVVAKCECGWDLKYFTNQDADAFEIKCISCEKPVLVKWNFRHKRYEKAD